MGIGPPQEDVGVVPAKISFIHDTAVGPVLAAAAMCPTPPSHSVLIFVPDSHQVFCKWHLAEEGQFCRQCLE